MLSLGNLNQTITDHAQQETNGYAQEQYYRWDDRELMALVHINRRGTKSLRRLYNNAQKLNSRITVSWDEGNGWNVSSPSSHKNRRNEELTIPREVMFTIFCCENAGPSIFHQISSHYRTRGLRTNDVSEVFSPPRVTKVARQFGLSPGYALDLTNVDETGKPWDLSDPEMQEKAIRIQSEQKPWLLIGCPPCHMFSQLQNLVQKATLEDWQGRYEKARQHLVFCTFLYIRQVEEKRYFLHEHPDSATSWAEPVLQEILSKPGVVRVTADMCRFGMVMPVPSKDSLALVKKPTGILTNSTEIARILDVRCSNQDPHSKQEIHEHVSLIGGKRASAAQVYPDKLCQAIVKGLKNELRLRGEYRGNAIQEDLFHDETSFPVEDGEDFEEPPEAEEAGEEEQQPEVALPPEVEPDDEADAPDGEDEPSTEQKRLLRNIHVN